MGDHIEGQSIYVTKKNMKPPLMRFYYYLCGVNFFKIIVYGKN